MLSHDNRLRDEFTRQAEMFAASAAITDAGLTQRFIAALGEAAHGMVLDCLRPRHPDRGDCKNTQTRWWRSISPRKC
jgi:hypothetical protein